MGRRSWVTKRNAGTLLGGAAVIAIIWYVYGYGAQKTSPHAKPFVGRGYGKTPYGRPYGNPGYLRELPPSKKGCGGCSHGCSC